MTSVNPEQYNAPVTSPDKIKVLFFGRSQCDATLKALGYLNRLKFEVTTVISGGRGEVLPEELKSWCGDYILCFRSLFILPKSLLDQASIAAINFHPGPTEYPGSGCLNFALYEDAPEYGVTAHLMNEKVDHGNILDCRRFPIAPGDTVDSLLERSHLKLLDLFFDIAGGIDASGKRYVEKMLASSAHERWRGEARRMKELDQLSSLDPGICSAELERVIRATYTERFPPKITLHGYEFVLKSNKRVRN
ncbi:hypothetical protein GCM10009504_28690 [Pseudomonas laurentiana]|uniref:Formyl transferase N-terminal domain-containing protein n=1 Tax=Pseudomonas laurentiana TaxID=2364649 RepID=A0A6I5RPI9_9PSED|nr:formyltransferase family protein [Pseudomonas laurentiana]NES09847.1 hypothetical protein [Pseudomonas laurentiana]GGU69717.1 hypothetical protein GCM10009504_28690 [Pseudomonas laurentiana]